jgi:hypothetical protein
VALVLVDVALRRQGIGRALMDHALAFLDGQGVASIRLDATPVGQPLYEQLGFVEQFRLARYEGIVRPTDEPASAGLLPVSAQRWPELAALDRAITATDRQRFLLSLFAEQPDEVRGVEGPAGWAGFIAARSGVLAVQLGPCVGEAGPLLLADACRWHTGQRIYLDAPVDNAPACRLAETRGLTVQRHLTRMCRGLPVIENLNLLWASAGPEKG